MKLITIIVGVFFLLFTALNYSGFCYSKMRRMNDAEYINAAVSEIISHDSIKRFKSVEQFKADYPACCKVLRFNDGAGGKINSLGPLLGFYSVIVVVRYDQESSGTMRPYEAHMLVNKCGEASFERGIEQKHL